MNWLEKPKNYIVVFAKWLFLGLVMGLVGGALGGIFHHALHFATHLRGMHPWLIFLLPLGGLATVGIYRLLGLKSNRGTNEIIDATLNGGSVSPLVAPAIFLTTGMTHMLGGSAGREGAALQLGGAVASALARLFRLELGKRRVLIMAGMSAVFAGLFSTPLTATIFCLEFASVGTLFTPALLPCFLAAFTAAKVSGSMGVHPEGYLLESVMELAVGNVWQYLLLAVLISFLGIFMCTVFHKAEHWAAHGIKNPWLRIALGGAVIAVLTLLVGDHRYNGAGMDMALSAVGGQAEWQDFALKLLFTAITLAAGFKGGEIVPTFCIGATFGCVAGGLLGLDPGFAAALGLVGLFCCATNSPLASLVLSIEMFGSGNLYFFALICAICFFLSGHRGLYSSQVIRFSKINILGDPIDRE